MNLLGGVVQQRSAFLTILGVIAGLSSSAFASTGELILDSSGFLRESNQRPNSSTFLIIGPKFGATNDTVEGVVDFKVFAFLPEASSTTAEAQNMYIATHSKLISNQQISLGRRQYDWSVADDFWTMGLWQPRFMWDPLRPMQVGLFGAFYAMETDDFRLLVHASPIAVPERGTPLYQSDGQIRSYGAWFNPLPTQVSADIGTGTTLVPIQYTLNMPAMSKTLLRPSAAAQIRYGGKSRYWASLSYGVMPVHQTDLAIGVPVEVSPSGDPFVNATVNVRFRQHELLTLETGYRGKVWSVWSSFSAERPYDVKNQAGQIFVPTGPAAIGIVGGTVMPTRGLQMSASFLEINERPGAGPDLGSSGGVKINNLSERFPFRRAFRLATSYAPNLERGFSTEVSWVSDIAQQSDLITTNFFYRIPTELDKGVLLGFGVDMIHSETQAGWIGQYRGNDRFRGSVSYVF